METPSKYWIDADGYLVFGLREKDKWVTVAEIQEPEKHIEPLAQLLDKAQKYGQ